MDEGLGADRAACETLGAFPGGRSLVFLTANRFGVIKASPVAELVLCSVLGALGKVLHIQEGSAFSGAVCHHLCLVFVTVPRVKFVLDPRERGRANRARPCPALSRRKSSKCSGKGA